MPCALLLSSVALASYEGIVEADCVLLLVALRTSYSLEELFDFSLEKGIL